MRCNLKESKKKKTEEEEEEEKESRMLSHVTVTRQD